jgi:N-acetylglucosaminyl-diphospho-decaprenol L-rhamnosyltransferase
MKSDRPFTPVIIVTYRNPDDVAACLSSLDALEADTELSLHICENGGAAAWDELYAKLLRPDGPCVLAEDVSTPFKLEFCRVASLRLKQSGRVALIADPSANLGYAGGINVWLRPLMGAPGWRGCWILNPDTVVAPDALTALTSQASNRNLGIVGSRIMVRATDTHVACWGLRWRRVTASGYLVGQDSPAGLEPEAETVEALLDSATGASCYITRACLETLFPLDERYFLFFEDFDWGTRARRAGFRVGYAHSSVVIHAGGNSIGTPSHGAIGSPLAVYLGFRNRLLFVRTHHPLWWTWTVLVSCLHSIRLVRRRGFGPAISGLFAGLRGETGRPEELLAKHQVRGSRPQSTSAPG